MTETGESRLRTLIADDEPLALGMLRSILAAMPEIELVAQCRNGREALAEIRHHSPELVFLDIQMPGRNGFDVVKSLQSDDMPMVVFATAYDTYAIKAFELHAVDYILKPLDADRVRQSVERALMRRRATQTQEPKTPLIGAIELIARGEAEQASPFTGSAAEQQGSFADGRLVIRDGGSISLVPMADIDWVDAAGDYMCVHAGGNTHILRSTLKQLADRLDPGIFRRVHRSTLVNVQRVRSITALRKGECMLHLEDGAQLKVSRNYRDAIADLLK